MLDRLVLLRRTVMAVMSNEEYFNTSIAKNLEMLKAWNQCEVLVNLLKPLPLVTIILCSEQQITISRHVKFVYCIICLTTYC